MISVLANLEYKFSTNYKLDAPTAKGFFLEIYTTET